jgi:uncharacterized protein YhaN
MIFRRIYVDGFGIWQDLKLDELSPGLNVFLAPNEGGKSTLMAFVRAVLFGFKRRSDPHRYVPLRGGTHGGYLDITTEGREFRVTRSDDGTSRGELEISGDDGGAFPTGKLENLLRGTTETLYENVFAFGLDELQRLDTLQDDDVAGHIYSAGMGAGAMSPVAFRQLVQDDMDRLFKARGRKQPIGELLTQIEEDEERIAQLRTVPEQHTELQRKELRMREKLETRGDRMEERQLEYDDLLRTQRAWPRYEELLEAEATLQTIGVEPELLRSATAEASLEVYGDADTTAHHEIAVDEAAVLSGRVDPAELMSTAQRGLLRHANKIRGLLSRGDRLRDLHTLVVDRQEAARKVRQALLADVEELGADWSLERVRSVRTDVQARDEVHTWAETIHGAEGTITATESRAGDANLVYEAMQETHEQIGRGTLIVTWGMILAAVAATSVLIPPPARFVSVMSVVSVGLLIGSLLSWLHLRGLRERRAEQAVAAQREAELWQGHDTAKMGHQETLADWSDWLGTQHLSDGLSPQGALDLLDRVAQTQTADNRSHDAQKGVDLATADLQRACMDVLAVLEDIDRRDLELRYDTMKMVDPLLATIGELRAELEDVEAHRERVRSVLERHSGARASLQALAGQEGADGFRGRLSSWDPDALARAVGTAQGKLRSVRADRDALNESLGALRQQISDMETDEALADALVERESRRAELVELVNEWAGHAVTTALYDEAKSKYEAERQPEVLKLAGQYFRQMTDGRYCRVIAPLGEVRLEVERTDTGERLAPAALSRGTGEQLYLSMRLALARAYGRRAVPLPLVADDILVNFDDDRARATAKLLNDFANEGHQIFAFTCHRHLAETFTRNAPDARLQMLPAHA